MSAPADRDPSPTPAPTLRLLEHRAPRPYPRPAVPPAWPQRLGRWFDRLLAG